MKNWKMGRSVVKSCHQAAVWLLYPWAHNSCGYMHYLPKIKPFKVPAWMGEMISKTRCLTKGLLAVDNC